MDTFDDLLLPAGGAAPPASVTVPAGAGGEKAAGAFEGADRMDSAIALWSSPLQSADRDILPEKRTIDGRTRSMMRNDAYVQGGANLHKDNIVGSHYLLNTRPSSLVLTGSQDDMWEEEFQTEVEEKWELASDSPDHWIDAARTNNFTSLVRMAVGIHTMAGEVLATAEWVRDDGAPFSTAIQMIDLDRLSDPQDAKRFQFLNKPGQRAGVRYNDRGAPISYFIRNAHPADYGPVEFKIPEWKEIAIRKPWGRMMVLHLFEQLRPEQTRGITEMASALKEMKLTHKWRDINIQNALTQSLYAAAITSDLPTEQVFQSLGGGTMDAAGVQAAITNYAEGYLGSIAQYAGAARGLQIDGVRIPHLYPGTKLDIIAPTKGGPLGSEFEQSLLRYIAASLGVSYEQLSRDYTHTNYSSARAAMTETWKFMQARKKLIADRFASFIFRLWLEEQIRNNEISAFPASKSPLLYTKGRLNLKFDAISRCEWIGASRGQIDEYKETQAAVLRIQNGLSTAEDELARLGKDWRKVYRQLKREQDRRELLGLIFVPTDPAAIAATTPDEPKDTAE